MQLLEEFNWLKLHASLVADNRSKNEGDLAPEVASRFTRTP